MDEDLKLVEEVLRGNLDSFNIIVNKYEFSILKFIYNTVHNKEAAEDIAQEVFITVYNKLYTFKRKYKFSSWIFQIARNKCIDYIRKYRRVYESNIEEEREMCSGEISPEQSAEFKETKKQVETFISDLEYIDKEILNLRYSGSFTFCEIAAILGINESTVKRRYYKVREEYKEYLLQKEKRCSL